MEKNVELNQIIGVVTAKFNQLENLISILEGFLNGESGELNSLLKVLFKPEKNLLEALAQNEYYYNISNLYPNILWSSIFLTAYSTFENSLTDICKFLQDGNSDDIKLNDLGHKGIHRAKVFIKKVVKLDFPDETEQWSFIKNSNLIRNCLIHGSGDLSQYKETDQIKRFITPAHGLREMENKLIVEKEFPLGFITRCIYIISELSTKFQ